jgi:hypothetical protein
VHGRDAGHEGLGQAQCGGVIGVLWSIRRAESSEQVEVPAAVGAGGDGADFTPGAALR